MVKVFQFPLQKVLNLKEMIEETKAIELQNSKAFLKREQKKLENLETSKHYLLDIKTENDIKQTNLNLNNLQVSMEYISQLTDMISTQTINVNNSNKSVDKTRNNLIEASKNTKIIEKLRERHLEVYKKNNRKREVKKDSEIAIRVSMKNKVPGDIV